MARRGQQIPLCRWIPLVAHRQPAVGEVTLLRRPVLTGPAIATSLQLVRKSLRTTTYDWDRSRIFWSTPARLDMGYDLFWLFHHSSEAFVPPERMLGCYDCGSTRVKDWLLCLWDELLVHFVYYSISLCT